MYLSRTTPYKITGFPDKKAAYKVWRIQFQDYSTATYLDEYQFRSLELGKKLQEAGVTPDLLKRLDDFIEEYGSDRYYEGLAQGEGGEGC